MGGNLRTIKRRGGGGDFRPKDIYIPKKLLADSAILPMLPAVPSSSVVEYKSIKLHCACCPVAFTETISEINSPSMTNLLPVLSGKGQEKEMLVQYQHRLGVCYCPGAPSPHLYKVLACQTYYIN